MDTVVEGGDESRCLDAVIPSCPFRAILICLESISILLSSPTVLGEKQDMLMVVKKMSGNLVASQIVFTRQPSRSINFFSKN
jgi:hypothetical protein